MPAAGDRYFFLQSSNLVVIENLRDVRYEMSDLADKVKDLSVEEEEPPFKPHPEVTANHGL